MHPRKYFHEILLFLKNKHVDDGMLLMELLKCNVFINVWVETNGNDQQTVFPSDQGVWLANNEKWYKFSVCESFIKIRKNVAVMMIGVKHYVKYSTNEYINK